MWWKYYLCTDPIVFRFQPLEFSEGHLQWVIDVHPRWQLLAWFQRLRAYGRFVGNLPWMVPWTWVHVSCSLLEIPCRIRVGCEDEDAPMPLLHFMQLMQWLPGSRQARKMG